MGDSQCKFAWEYQNTVHSVESQGIEYRGGEKRTLDVFLLQLISLGCKPLDQECMCTAGFMKINHFPNTFPAGPAETLGGVIQRQWTQEPGICLLSNK